MGVPIFFLLLLIAVIVLIVAVFIYFQLYKRNINKVLEEGMSKHNQMVPPHKAASVVVTLVLMMLTGVICYFIGYKNAYDDFEYGLSQSTASPYTFYAEITDIRDRTIQVTGLSVNDINFRGDFVFPVHEETEIEWRYTKLEFGELDIGDTIAITFDGEVLETSPAQIEVFKIQLLDDKK